MFPIMAYESKQNRTGAPCLDYGQWGCPNGELRPVVWIMLQDRTNGGLLSR